MREPEERHAEHKRLSSLKDYDELCVFILGQLRASECKQCSRVNCAPEHVSA